jgi:hypothetical protein
MKMLIRKVFGLLVLGGFLAFCWFAYQKYDKVMKIDENAALKASLAQAQQDNAALRSQVTAILTAADSRLDGVKKALLILLPQGAAEIEKAFSPLPPAAAKVVGKVDAEFKYDMVASNHWKKDDAATYAAGPLHCGGLAVDVHTGVISGTPKEAGTYVITLSSTDAKGKVKATVPLILTVEK